VPKISAEVGNDEAYIRHEKVKQKVIYLIKITWPLPLLKDGPVQ